MHELATAAPAGWKLLPLGDCIEHVIDFRGRTPRKLGMDWGDGTIPALSALNVRMGEIDLERATYFGSRKLYEKWMTSGPTRRGDVLITMEAPLGNIAQIPDDQQYILSQRVVLIRFSEDQLQNNFAAWLMRSQSFQRNLVRWSTGTTATGIQRAKLVQIPLFICSLPEQRRITEILDTVDDAIRKTEEIITKLQQVKQGLLHDLLTRGIDDNGELRDPVRRPDLFKESSVGLIPKVWETDRLENLTERIVDGVHHTPTYVERGIPFLTVQNLTRTTGVSMEPQRYVSETAHAEYRRRADPRPGDVLVSKDGTLGVARIVPEGLPEFSIFVSIALLRPRLNRVRSEIVREFFETASYERQLGRQSAGTGLKHIHLEHFREFCLTVPPLPEQDRIIAVLRAYNQRLGTEGAVLAKAHQVKEALMDDLLTGRVRVTPLLKDATP